MNENDVVNSICWLLEKHGYSVISKKNTYQQGVDITAKHTTSGEMFFVEAKGNTSSKDNTAKFGQPFSNSQVKNHVSAAFFCVAKIREENPCENTRVAIAVPDNTNYRSNLEKIKNTLSVLRVEVIYVSESLAANFDIYN